MVHLTTPYDTMLDSSPGDWKAPFDRRLSYDESEGPLRDVECEVLPLCSVSSLALKVLKAGRKSTPMAAGPSRDPLKRREYRHIRAVLCGVLLIRALLLGSMLGAPDFWRPRVLLVL